MAYSNFGAQFQAFVIRVANSIKELVTKTDTLTSNITTLNTNAVKTINNNKPTNGNITPAQTGCLPLSGGNITSNLTVQNKNVVRSVNGTTAGTNGNVTLTKQNIIDSLGYTPPTTDTKYTLPNATSSVLGGVKIGSNITVSSGTISLSKSNVTSALGYTPVKTVNGTAANASGNVAIDTFFAPALKISWDNISLGVDKTTTKTVTGLIPRKPVFVDGTCSVGAFFGEISSGKWYGSSNAFGCSTDSTNEQGTVFWPVSTSITFKFENGHSEKTSKASYKIYQ